MDLNSVFVHGLGAVTPAGWSVSSLRAALEKGEPLPVEELPRPGWTRGLRVRRVPPLSSRPAWLMHPRLRRVSAISRFAASAAVEALGDAWRRERSRRLGIVLCVTAGCVSYTRRFYEETLRDPVSASPLLFPETVYNAPASHVAALFGATGPNYTLLGDASAFLTGAAIGAQWLVDGQAEACLVIGAEEMDWLLADAHHRFERSGILSEGAGALLLSIAPPEAGRAVQLAAITDAHSFVEGWSRADAALAMRKQLPASASNLLLCDGLRNPPKPDEAERNAWSDWEGPRLSPNRLLGNGLAAGSAWQCIAGLDAILQQRCDGCLISLMGPNQQAIGAHFVAADHPQFTR
ncbi:MAG: beta-ketoacyl synthase N-terminal-like domain-containing protein [Verrucomicrobiia bacterium]